MTLSWNKNKPLSHGRLVELLSYNQNTGEFRWRVNRNSYGGKAKIGSMAGQIDRHGYRYIGVDGRVCQAHILAWVYIHQKWPDVQIDHKNAIPDDNRISNLREATMTQQRANQKVRKDSKLGIKGVEKTTSGTYRAVIRKHGIVYRLGHYGTALEAAMAYKKSAQRLFGEFART